MKLGKIIESIRKENNLTQEEFAQRFNVTRQSVSNWENEKSYPDLLILVKISNDFNVSLDYMLKEDVDMTEKMDKDIKYGETCTYLGGISAILLIIIALELMILNYGNPTIWIVFFLMAFINIKTIKKLFEELSKKDKKTKFLFAGFVAVISILSFAIICFIR